MHETMKILIPAILVALAACSGTNRNAASKQSDPAQPRAEKVRYYDYRISAVYPHPTDSYTQGLFFADGILWEGTGQEGKSVLQQLNLETGRPTVIASLPNDQFGEGIALLDDKIYQLTWQSNTVHVYDVRTGRRVKRMRYPGEGWGLTTDGRKLYMSNGSERIYTIDPETFRREKSVEVTLEGKPLRYLNELEWIDGKIWANVYTTDQIVIVDPASGRVEGVVDLTGLLPVEDITAQTDVLNGIAYDTEGKRLFVTGKNWDKLFQIEIIER